MKHYPTEILLTVTEPRTGRETMRWFQVKNEQNEKFVRSQNKTARESIAAARKRMAEAIGADAQKMVVENLQEEFVQFYRREDTQRGELDGGGRSSGTTGGNKGQLHPDSGPERADSASGSGSGQAQGREDSEESPDGARIFKGSEEPIEAT